MICMLCKIGALNYPYRYSLSLLSCASNKKQKNKTLYEAEVVRGLLLCKNGMCSPRKYYLTYMYSQKK